MTDIRLPPLRLNSPNSLDTPRSNESTATGNLSARERRRLRNKQKNEADNSILSDNSRRPPSLSKSRASAENEERAAPRRKPPKRSEQNIQEQDEGHQNSGYVSDEAKVSNNNVETTSIHSKKSRRSKSSDDKLESKRRHRRSNKTTTSLAILEGLEEDIIESNDNETEASSGRVSDTGQKSLIKQNDYTRKSMPVDKYFLETDNKFEIQPKQVYERRIQNIQKTELEAALKIKQKEELKYQILTPKISLNAHKFLRIIFLFIHGLNVGTQFWQAVAIYTLNYLDYYNQSSISTALFWVYKNLALPFHCLSYFFLTLCIIDVMDRVDFTRMNGAYFKKSITFQNHFWCVIFYAVAFVSNLSMITIDDEIYINYLTTETNSTVISGLYTAMGTGNDVSLWSSLSAVKAAFSMLSWLVFAIFSHIDMTFESLEKREFSLLDDLVPTDGVKPEEKSFNETNQV